MRGCLIVFPSLGLSAEAGAGSLFKQKPTVKAGPTGVAIAFEAASARQLRVADSGNGWASAISLAGREEEVLPVHIDK